jgi:hypothetical protein
VAPLSARHTKCKAAKLPRSPDRYGGNRSLPSPPIRGSLPTRINIHVVR